MDDQPTSELRLLPEGVDLAALVRELADRAEIEALLHKLCLLVDSFELERLVNEVYAMDGSDDHGGGPVVGRTAIRAWYEDSTRNVAAMAHNISNLVVTIDGDRATAHSNVVAWIWTMANAPAGRMRNVDYALSLRYVDELSRYAEGWRVDRRALVPNVSKTGDPYLVAIGQLPSTQKGIHALSLRDTIPQP
jgi:hypothetical protein